ncbi:MAG TPA: N-acetyl-1-D-myo-inositol-2-amino-2-deoxy-alpha-D-glucopyranoside deacetylase [Streptosporangiaceae bacterium]
MTSPADRRLLLVHAHPDDESIGTGATMARYAAEGAQVTLVTCTLGELGEIIPPGLAHLAAGAGDQLGGYRIGELAAACAVLGVCDHRFLGGAGRWRDSGMIGTPENEDPRCFWRASLDEAALDLAAVIREVRPQVMVTYDDDGFYGHPDHIQAHRVAWRAFALAADPAVSVDGGLAPWAVAKFYASTTPRSALEAEMTELRAARARDLRTGGDPGLPRHWRLPESEADLVYGVPDEQVSTEIDGTGHLDAKLAAMAAHATQITVAGRYFALSNGIAQLASGLEYYSLVATAAGGSRRPDVPDDIERSRPVAPAPREADLFAGLGLDPSPPASPPPGARAQPVPPRATAGRAG